MMRGVAERKIGDEVVVSPGADTTRSITADVVSAPACGECAAKLIAVVERKSKIAWRVAFTAMRQCFSQIGAAVPLRTSGAIRLEALIGVEQGGPDAHCPALIEWKEKIIRLVGQIDRREGEQIGLYGERISIGDIGVGGVRHRRIKVGAIPTEAPVH